MQLSVHIQRDLAGSFRMLKTPAAAAGTHAIDVAVSERVSEMLLTIEAGGMDAVLRYARELDGWNRSDVELTGQAIRASGDTLSPGLRNALELGSERTQAFAREQRAHLVDFEIELVPGLLTGQRYIPVNRVGAYLPAGRFPLLSSAFMLSLIHI